MTAPQATRRTGMHAAVFRAPLTGHDGRSGARLERVVLADGRRLVIKHSRPAHDLGMLISGDVGGRERALWSAGVLDRLPAGVDHAILDCYADGEQIVTVMHDLGAAVMGWRGVSRAACRRLFDAVTAVHAAFVGDAVPQACTLGERLGMLSPTRIRARCRDTDPLAAMILRGWERFAAVAPADVAEAVAAIHDDPALLAAPLARRPATLIHGDLTLPNAALEGDRVTLLDWSLATWAPPALELPHFLAICWSSVAASREEIIADFREASGELDDPVALRLAMLAGLAQMGWNKAHDITEHPDEAVRASERADLDWWVRQARQTLDAGLL